MVNPVDQFAVTKERKEGKLVPRLLAVRKAVNDFVHGRSKHRSGGNYLEHWGPDEVGDFDGPRGFQTGSRGY